ncbi:IS630 family transposase, partial [Lichenihabitans sp. Uapishka_5]|nr:IS630 family transposase [Lichenihabitans sp. Uapishka_5]
MRDEPHRLVFVDETAVTTKLTRLRGRSRRGTRLPGAAPFGHWKAQTFIAGLRCHGVTAPWIVDGAMNRTAF